MNQKASNVSCVLFLSTSCGNTEEPLPVSMLLQLIEHGWRLCYDEQGVSCKKNKDVAKRSRTVKGSRKEKGYGKK